jgi:hypothetical protein
MHCTICHFVSHAYNYGSATKKKNGLITYSQQHGITSMKKHVTFEHGDAWAKWGIVNLNLATKDDQCRKKSKCRYVVGYGAITYHFGTTTFYKKEDSRKNKFMEDFLMFVAKGYMPIFVVENQWLRFMVLCQNPEIVFPNMKQMVQHAIPKLVVKTMEKIVMPTLESYLTTSSFDLWMSRFGHDTFVFVINFINSHWVPCHVTVGLFEATNTFGVTMVAQVKELLSFYNLLEKLIAYAKDEGYVHLHKSFKFCG